MALADYFHRSAVAAAQVLDGYSEEAIAESLASTVVALSVDSAAAATFEGSALLDLELRILARLYPRLVLSGAASAPRWVELAKSINPAIALDDGEPTVAIAIGDVKSIAPFEVYVGSNAWDAHISTTGPRTVGQSRNPFGAGAAACLAAANVFRHVFAVGGLMGVDIDACLSTLDFDSRPTGQNDLDVPAIQDPFVLVGAGAIGNGTIWALSLVDIRCPVHVVDPEFIELGNLQRYILTTRVDEDRLKTALAADHLPTCSPAETSWDAFVASKGYAWNRVLVAVDSAEARRSVQATVPRWIANGWTQPGDLGVSIHPWTEEGACLSCLYNPPGKLPNEDELIASALSLSHAEDGLEIRRLLHTDLPPTQAFLEKVAKRLGRPLDILMQFKDRPLRDLYVHGVCGGDVVPLDLAGRPAASVHVPLAHQSALAGVLLASRLAGDVLRVGPGSTLVTRIDVQRPLTEVLTQPAMKDPRQICLCQDADYQKAWARKYT